MARVLLFADVPETYKPKAGFALKTMLSAFFRYDDIRIVNKLAAIPEESDAIRLYYGTDARQQDSRFDVRIQMAAKAPAFFEGKKARKAEDVITLNSPETNLPLLFGDAETAGETPAEGYLPWDVVASAFYFLSDWEAWLPKRPADMHGRLPYSSTLQAKLNLADRPIVNEYAALIIGCITSTKNVDIKPKMYGGHEFAACITHDFDRIEKRYRGTFVREFFEIPFLNPHGFPREERVRRFRKSVADLLQPGDGYERSILGMFALEEELGIKPTVLVKSILEKHKNDAADYLSYPFFNTILERVGELRGEIGLHASYEAGYNEPLYHQEIRQLEARVGQKIRTHRFHYLRYRHERLPRLLSAAGLFCDSSVGWAERAGFRAGFTHPYFLFDLERNAASPVLEIPLLMMEMQLLQKMQLSPQQALEHACRQADIVRRYGGVLCWDFHHHALDDAEAEGAGFLFEQALRYLHHQNPIYLTMSQVYEHI